MPRLTRAVFVPVRSPFEDPDPPPCVVQEAKVEEEPAEAAEDEPEPECAS